jgi:hypothetical protein
MALVLVQWATAAECLHTLLQCLSALLAQCSSMLHKQLLGSLVAGGSSKSIGTNH